MAFISLSNTSSGKSKGPTVQGASTASVQVPTVSTDVAAASLSYDTTGKKITIQGSDVAGFDKSKVECFNCHKTSHFVRECRSPRSQDRGKRESYKKNPNVEELAPKAMIAIDGIRCDWSYIAEEDEASKNHTHVADEEEVPTEYALMAKSSSSSVNELYGDSFCSKSCRKNTKNLNTKISKLNEELSDCETELVFKRDIELKDNKIEYLKNELEEKDLSWIGLPELVDDTVADYTRPTPSLDVSKSVSKEQEAKWKSNHPSFFEQGGSSGNVVPKPMIKFMKESGCPNATKVNNTENARKPTVKYAEMYRNTSQSIPQDKINDKGYWDNGCSRHMTGNISYLSGYEPFNRRYVSFSHGRGQITGKGSIKTVNTACYVQNRVLVTKPHNKTAYELFNERSPAIGFLIPFRCHVMILNTLDHLGKFDAKGDEGYFVGYFLSSKEFSVFNKRTEKIEENLHVDFLENKSIEKGTGPDRLFDIDTLTNFMNYVPVVVAETSSTNISGTKEDVHQTAAKNDDEIPDNNSLQKDQQEVNGDKEVPKSSRNSNPTASSKVSNNDSFELASSSTVETNVPTVSSPVPTDKLYAPQDGTGKDVELYLYRSMIGSLMYLTTSRLNIMFAVCACARHQVTSKECHLYAVKRIFRYLKGNPNLGIWYPKEYPFDLVSYSDSDYDSANQDRKSTTRGCQFLERRDVRYGEAFPTDTSLDADQDRENIAKTSAMPHEALPRVTSLGGGKGRSRLVRIMRREEKDFLRRMLQTLGMDQGEDLLDKDKSADKGSDSTDEMPHVLGSLGVVNILASGGLRSVFTTASLSVATTSTCISPVVATASGIFPTAAVFTIASVATPTTRVTRSSRGVVIGSSSPIYVNIPSISKKDKGKILGIQKLDSGGLKSVFTTACLSVATASIGISPAVATASRSFLTAVIFTTASVATPTTRVTRSSREVVIGSSSPISVNIPSISKKDKGKGKMTKPEQPSKEKRDSEIARIHTEKELEMMIAELDRSNEMVAKYLSKYEQAAIGLSHDEKVELINEILMYQRHLAQIKKYQSQ
nr:uncharacterized mitochondrial protein AtMg00810-like [Tanacetum cinerariifolium]